MSDVREEFGRDTFVRDVRLVEVDEGGRSEGSEVRDEALRWINTSQFSKSSRLKQHWTHENVEPWTERCFSGRHRSSSLSCELKGVRTDLELIEQVSSGVGAHRGRETHKVVDETPEGSDRPAHGKHTDVSKLSSHFCVFASEVRCGEELFAADALEERFLVLGVIRIRVLLARRSRRLVVLELLGDLGSKPSLEVRESDFGSCVRDLSSETVRDELTLELVGIDHERSGLERRDGGSRECVSVARGKHLEDPRYQESSERDLQGCTSRSMPRQQMRRQGRPAYVDETREEEIAVRSDKVECKELDRETRIVL